MKIITIPHKTLRQRSKPVEVVDKKLVRFVQDLQDTLLKTRNPQGVGLAAPQVNSLQRIFVTNVDKKMRSFINPAIIGHSKEIVLGPPKKDNYLEGCLSIPGVYGPVPRYEWVELEFFVLDTTNKSLTKSAETFKDYEARVVQHELDHLDGALFIDYTLRFDLPLYEEDKKTKKLEEVDPSLFKYV